MNPDPWLWQPAGARRLEQAVSLIRLDGADSLRFLHGQTSAAIEGSPAGCWIPTCRITATGRLRALAEVLVDGGGAWLVISGGDGDAVWQALDRVLFPADQVQLGPVTPARLITPLGEGLEQLPHSPEGQWLALEHGRGWLLGQRLVLLAESDRHLPQWLADRPVLSAREQERWRIQQGLPAAPGEVNADTNPFEAGLADRVSLSKGCYVGQETLAKLATYDGVKQQLRRWHWRAPEGDGSGGATATLAPGMGLVVPGSGPGSAEGDSNRAGQITAALALDDGLWIGLALVRRRALPAPQLAAGSDSQAPLLELSRPPAFVDPPVGAGRQP